MKGWICFVTIFSLLLLSINIAAQDASIRKLQAESLRSVKKNIPDTVKRAWTKGAVYSINVGQGSLSNWAAGGDDFSLSIATALNLYGFYKKDKHSWDNTLDINFGYVNTSSLGSRKNDDRFDLLSKYGHAISNKFSMGGAFNVRSQLLKGYTYKDTVRRFSSDFMSPGYVLVSLGMDYKPVKELSIFASPVTSRWVIVRDDTLSAKGEYGVDPGSRSMNELGAFATINFQKPFNKYISYKGRLDLFSNYKRDPQNVDLYMTNMFTTKVARILAFTWSVDMIYDDDVRLFGDEKDAPALQLKSLFGIGLQVKI